MGEGRKRAFYWFLALETPFRLGWGRGVSALFTSPSPAEPSSWPLGTLARRSSSRRRLLSRLVWAFSKMGSRLACLFNLGCEMTSGNQTSVRAP